MSFLNTLRRIGWLLFMFMWIPFTCIFVGMAAEMGGIGRDFARMVSDVVPGLMDNQPWGATMLTTVSFILTFALMFAAMGLLFGVPILSGFRNRRVLKTGRLAEARILSVAQTGMYINNNPMVKITLEVTPSDGRPFEAETEKLLYLTQIPQFQPGVTVSVRYDPETQEVAITDESAR